MARLESVARAGYYPTPPRVAAAIAQHLGRAAAVRGAYVRLLDPCAGTGEAAARSPGSGRGELRHRAERGARRRRARTARSCAAHVGLHRPPGERRLLLPVPQPAVRLRRREPAPRARIPDEPDAGALPRRRARLRRPAADWPSPLATWPVTTATCGIPLPRPRVRRFPADRALRDRKPKVVSRPAAQAELEAWSRGDLAPLPDIQSRPT